MTTCYQRRKAQGLCPRCGKVKSPEDGSWCFTCRARRKVWIAKRRSQGVCISCAEPLPANYSSHTCSTCLSKVNTRRSKRTTSGFCRDCGKPALPDRVRCSSCLAVRAKTCRARVFQGFCRDCPAKAEPGKTRCIDCLLKHRVLAHRIRQTRELEKLNAFEDLPKV